MCYCEKAEKEILADLQKAAVPDEALLRECCWKKVRQVRGKRFQEISDLMWTKLCDRRVQLTMQPQQGTA
jgi:hypothetical protein